MFISGFIGLAYEGISSFLHNRSHKALHKAVQVIDSRTTIQHNKLMHLEHSIVLYGIYNAGTLENLIHTLQFYYGNRKNYLQDNLTQPIHGILTHPGTQQYAIESLLYLRSIRDKYIQMYK